MSDTNNGDTSEPREHTDQKNNSKPNRWSFYVLLLLKHDHAPHWTIALFTLVLVIFAWRAWVESTIATKAIQGQLTIMQADQRPFVSTLNIAPPNFIAETGQIVWNATIGNYGKGVAYNLTLAQFLKVGTEQYRSGPRGDGTPVIVSGSDLPPGRIDFFSVLSHPGYKKEYFDSLLTRDSYLGMLVEFSYEDASGDQHFFHAVCIERLASGAFLNRSPKDCKK